MTEEMENIQILEQAKLRMEGSGPSGPENDGDILIQLNEIETAEKICELRKTSEEEETSLATAVANGSTRPLRSRRRWTLYGRTWMFGLTVESRRRSRDPT